MTENGFLLAKEQQKLYDSISRVQREYWAEFTTVVDRNKYKMAQELDENDLRRAYMLALDAASQLKKEEAVIWEQAELETKLKEVLSNMAYIPPRYGYSIKYRQQSSDGLKLIEVYGYIDSLSREATIRPDKLQLTDIPTAQQNLIELSSQYAKTLSKRTENNMKVVENFNEIKKVLSPYLK